MARMAETVHSAVEMLCAPCALQMVTCGPTVAGIHSVPAIRESTSRTPRSMRPDAPRPRLIRIGNPHLDLDLVVQPVLEGHEFHFGRQSTPRLWIQNCRISNANSLHDDWVSVSNIMVPAKTKLAPAPAQAQPKNFRKASTQPSISSVEMAYPKRRWPSPCAPKTTPGTVAICAFSRRI